MARKAKKVRSELVHEVESQRATTFQSNVPYEDVLQEVLDLRVAEFRYAQSKVDEITDDIEWRDTMSGKQPNEWILLRDKYAGMLAAMAKDLIAVGLAQRQVRIAEAQVEIVAVALQKALVQADLEPALVQRVGKHFRRELEVVSGSLAEGTK